MSLKKNSLTLLLASLSLFGEVKTWNQNLTGSSWNHPEHWTPAEIPRLGDLVFFNTLPEIPQNQFMISILAPSVAGGLEFNNQNPNTSYFLFGKVPLRLESPSTILLRETNQTLTKIDAPLLITKDLSIQNFAPYPLILNGSLTGRASSLHVYGPGEIEIGGEENNTFSGKLTIRGTRVSLNKSKGLTALEGDVEIHSGSLEGFQIAKTATVSLVASEGNSLFNVGQGKAAIQNLRFHYSPYWKEVRINKGGELTLLNSIFMTDSSKLSGEGTIVMGGDSSLSFKGLGENGEIETQIDLQGQNRTFFVDSGILIINGKIKNGALTKTGAGTLSLKEENLYGPTFIKEGTLLATTNSLPGKIFLDGTLQIDQDVEGSFKEPLLGSGELLKTGDGLLNISQDIPFNGTFNLQQGSLFINALGIGGDLHVDTLLSINADSSKGIEGRISGSGTINKMGKGTLTLNGMNSFNGNLNLNEGSIDGSTNSIKGRVTNNAFLSFTQDFDGVFSGSLDGHGKIAKNGIGAIAFNQKNDHFGTFFLNHGKLVLAHNEALGSSSLEMLHNTTLALTPNTSIANPIDLVPGKQAMLNVAIGKSSINGSIQGGTFVKTGDGSLGISGGGNVEGLFVTKGSLELTGELESIDPIIIEKGTKLFGIGRIIGTIHSKGTISGGEIIPENVPFDMEKAIESFDFEKSVEEELNQANNFYLVGDFSTKSVSGKAKITGDVNLNSESIFLVNFNPDSFSQMSVNGDVFLNNAILQLEPFAGSYRIGKEYKILDAKTIQGEFGEVVTPFPMINPIVRYNTLAGNVSVFFEMQMHYFSDLFKTGNAGEVAKCLDFLAEHPCENSNTVVAALINTQPESALKSSLEKMQPSQLNSLTVQQENDLFYARNAIFQRLYDIQKSCIIDPEVSKPPLSFWGSFFGGYTTQENEGGDPGYLAKSPGVIFGADLVTRNNTTFGGAISYAYTGQEWNNSRGDASIHNIYASLYGQYAGERGYVEASLLGGYSFYDVKRNLIFGPFNSTKAVANSAFGGEEGAIDLKVGMRFPFETFSISPFASFDYMLVNLNSFKEKGARSLNLKVESHIADLFTTEGGLQFDFCQKKDSTNLKGFIRMSAILENRFFGEEQNSSFTCGGSMKTEGFYPTRVLAGLGMGMSAAFGRNVFAVSYQLKTQWQFTDQSMTFQYHWKF